MLPILNRCLWKSIIASAAGALAMLPLLASCGGTTADDADGKKTVVVTYSILGSLVRDAVGDAAEVVVLIPNGSDPHDWEPSAKDIERLNNADLIVRNGLDLEGGVLDVLNNAKDDGVATFVASDHITIRLVGEGEGLPTGDPDQEVGAQDPHLWMDPLTLRDVMLALGPVLIEQGIDVADGMASVVAGLDTLDAEVESVLGEVPEPNRKLVTGHESMGYFAERYGFRLIGAIVPNISSQAEASAGELAALTGKVREAGVPAIFAEAGTPQATVEAIAADTGAEVVELSTHNLPADGTYRSFMLDIASTIADALR
ncbi:MAG: metal ABC transporter substrate-binding protein [Ilumatobacteraceae bacterium]|nr:metal ABC transporter substrate-binding protein [Ilumatobacteraceae bacterium]